MLAALDRQLEETPVRSRREEADIAAAAAAAGNGARIRAVLLLPLTASSTAVSAMSRSCRKLRTSESH